MFRRIFIHILSSLLTCGGRLILDEWNAGSESDELTYPLEQCFTLGCKHNVARVKRR